MSEELRPPSVEDEAVNAEDHTMFCDVEEPAYRRKTKIRIEKEREREREREAQKISLYSRRCNSYNQPLQKVTKSLYIVTHLGQLPFMLFT